MFDDSQNQPQTTNTNTDIPSTQPNDNGAPAADNPATAPSTFPPVSTDGPSDTGDLIAPTSPPTIGANDSSAFDPSVLDSVMNDPSEQTDNKSDTTPAEIISTASDIPSEAPPDTPGEAVEPTASAIVDSITAPVDETTSSSEASDSTNTSTDSSELLEIKQQALQELSPLVSKLDQTPEEKFRTTMMMIQASDDQSLISSAYESAKAITDDKTRAQAILDVINEINYFSSQSKTDQEQ